MSNYVQIIFPSGIASTYESAFTGAASFWNNVITAGSKGYTFSSNFNTNARCGVAYTFPAGTTLKGLAILSQVAAIDGSGGILGQAGPCYLQNSFPIVGIMTFDSADSNKLVASGQFDEVIIHEMGHVIGIGSLWSYHGLVSNPCTSSPCTHVPTYTGQYGIEGFEALGDSGEVPVSNERGQGTWNAHWNEAYFDYELMTGFLNSNSPNPLSILSVKSLKDLGYTVNLGSAEDYSIPSELARPLGGVNFELPGEILDFDLAEIADIDMEFARQAQAVDDSDQISAEFAGVFILMAAGFVALIGMMFFFAQRQTRSIEEVAIGLRSGVANPMVARANKKFEEA